MSTTQTPGDPFYAFGHTPDMTSPEPSPTVKPPKRKRTVPLFVAILGALGVGLVSCVAGVATGGGTPKAAPAPAASTVTKTVQLPAPAASTVTVTKEVGPPPPKDRIEDGSWVAGEDFPPGTYKTTNSGDDCYWAIYKPGANPGGVQGILENANGGGNLRVTLQQGQGFTTHRCGTWGKVG